MAGCQRADAQGDSGGGSVVTRFAPTNPVGGDILVYEDPDGEVRVDVRLEHETVWLSLTQMAELFGRDKSVISRQLRNVFQSGELERQATVAKIATVRQEGGREIEYFNLDAILSVGYRVNSKRGRTGAVFFALGIE
jgi:hypothetical protein